MRHPRLAVVLCALLLAGSAGIAGGATALADGSATDDRQSQSVREGGTYSGGTVVVEGPVDGDVRVFAGTVIVRGTVDGDVELYAGSVQVLGELRGDLEAFAGTVVLDGEVAGDLSVAAGTLAIDGRVGGTVRSASGTTQLSDNAVVAGDLRYSGELDRSVGAEVGGGVVSDPTLEVGPVLFPPVAGWFFAAFVVLAHLSLGAFLLLAFPGFARTVGDTVATDPLVTGAAGLGVLIGVPVVLGFLAVTIVGIPLALTGLFAYLVVLWVGTVYGRFAVGYWLVRRAGRDSPWLGLVVGLVGLGFLIELPVLGRILQFATLLLGLGALGVSAGREFRRRRGDLDGADSATGQVAS